MFKEIFRKSNAAKILTALILILISVIITINVIYIKAACSTKVCVTVNLATIFLLIWAGAFLVLISKD
jgi:hypothetical protein|tara:strand:- start:495 stop:698 length:204 start_codon:yes stop_codon:yes gene_type:complete